MSFWRKCSTRKRHFVVLCLLMMLSVLILMADKTVRAEALFDPALSDKYVETEEGAYFNEESGVTLFGEYDVDGNWVPQSRTYTDNEGREVYENPDESGNWIPISRSYEDDKGRIIFENPDENGNWVPQSRMYTDNEGRDIYETPDEDGNWVPTTRIYNDYEGRTIFEFPDEDGNWVPRSRTYEDDKGRIMSEAPDGNGNWVLTGISLDNGQRITAALRLEGEWIKTGYFNENDRWVFYDEYIFLAPEDFINEDSEIMSEPSFYSGDPIYLCGNTELSEFDFNGKKEITVMTNNSPEDFFDQSYYVVSNVPGVSLGYAGSKPISLATDNNESNDPQKYSPTKYALEFISGDERLKNAVTLEEIPYEGAVEVFFSINNYKLKGEGEAVFRITAENDKYYYQQEKTLRIVDFLKESPFIIPELPIVVTGSPGVSFKWYNIITSAFTPIMTGGDVNLLMSATSTDKNELEQYDGFSLWKEGYDWYYTANKAGAYDVNLKATYRNIMATIPCRILISDYHIVKAEDADKKGARTGQSWLKPGESCQYTVKMKDGTFSWKIEGEGAEIDEVSGLVTVKEDAEPGSVLIITATPEDGDLPVCMNLFISSDE